ncbi:hypothetical protein Tco_0432018 [Tanacetum coccineum]
MIVMTSMIGLESLFGPLFDDYFNGENQVVLKSSAVTTADTSDKHQQQPNSTSSTSTLATTVTTDGNFDLQLLHWRTLSSTFIPDLDSIGGRMQVSELFVDHERPCNLCLNWTFFSMWSLEMSLDAEVWERSQRQCTNKQHPIPFFEASQEADDEIFAFLQAGPSGKCLNSRTLSGENPDLRAIFGRHSTLSMHIWNDPSFFSTNKTGDPQGEELGLIRPLSDSSFSCSDNSFISEAHSDERARALQVKHQGLVSVSPPLKVSTGTDQYGQNDVALWHLGAPGTIMRIVAFRTTSAWTRLLACQKSANLLFPHISENVTIGTTHLVMSRTSTLITEEQTSSVVTASASSSLRGQGHHVGIAEGSVPELEAPPPPRPLYLYLLTSSSSLSSSDDLIIICLIPSERWSAGSSSRVTPSFSSSKLGVSNVSLVIVAVGDG